MNQNISFKVEAEIVMSLNKVLKSEQDALINNDLDVVENLLDQKSELLQTLSQSSLVRYKQLAKFGYVPNEIGMMAWLLKHVAKLAEWEMLQNSLAAAKEFNRVNAILVTKFILRNQQSLAVLQKSNQQSNLYGANGLSMAHRFKSGSIFG